MAAVSILNLPNDCIINTPRGVEFKKQSFFYRHTHLVEKMMVDYGVYQEIISYFDETFNIHDFEHTQRVWDQVLSSRNITWKVGEELTAGKLKKIHKGFEETLIYTGKGIECSASGEGNISAMCNLLLAKEGGLPTSFFRWDNLKRILLTKDPVYLEEFRTELEDIMLQGLTNFQSAGMDETTFKGFIFNIVALIAFTYPDEGDTVKIPMKIEGKWEVATYSVDKKFEMTPSWFSSPLPIFGLVAKDSKAPPILSCLGTTFPAGDGFMAALLSDCTPGMSVGHAASLHGKEELASWLEGKSNVHATGMSLGGALTLHTARLHPGEISQVYAYNPAGLYPWNWKGIDHSATNFEIYYQENDLVATMGYFPEGENVNFYRVLSHKSEDFVSAHAKTYTAAEKVTILRTTAKAENRRIDRNLLTLVHMIVSPIIFLAVLPFQLLYRLCEIVYQLISSLCYDDSPEAVDEESKRGAELL